MRSALEIFSSSDNEECAHAFLCCGETVYCRHCGMELRGPLGIVLDDILQKLDALESSLSDIEDQALQTRDALENSSDLCDLERRVDQLEGLDIARDLNELFRDVAYIKQKLGVI